jgi:flagellar biosynthesis chaperone FliJ
MKRFQFPLERVLRFRQLQAEAEQARLEQRRAELARIDEHLVELDREGTRTEDAVRRSLGAENEVLSGQMVTYPGYRSVLSRSRRGLSAERGRALEAIERQWAVVVEARRTCEILERARASAFGQWQAGFARELESTAGELFLNKWKKPGRKVIRPER